MNKKMFYRWFFYSLIAPLVVGWLMLFQFSHSLFGGEWMWAFWVTHAINFATWAIVGGSHDYFRSED